ncbi:MAG: pyruvate dehydrogenase [Deltaproteobacteria bacterium]|nr:pyruvate dehydrogenase [Deltaproteobacteria bacterium]
MKPDKEAQLIERIARRTFAYATKMIFDANHREDAMEGDPKVGGHPAACSSAVHILSAIHLGVRGPDDMMAIKPHASPVDHALNFQLGLLHEIKGRRWLSTEEGKTAMRGLRKFSQQGEPVFQSYHSEWDPDGEYFFPSGSVGIPPVSALYTALAYRYAEDHGLEAPKDAHFWCLIGDSEFREGSLAEAMPEAVEREIGNLTWIVDYNRQNLDGIRIVNPRGFRGTDAERIEKVSAANGWEVIQVRHGRKRLALFEKPGGEALQRVLEDGISDFHFQTLLFKKDGAVVRENLYREEKKLEKVLKGLSDAELFSVFADLGGHDVRVLLEALRASKKDVRRPTLIVAHTVKGWGLEMMAAPGNHSALPEESEMDAILASEGLKKSDPFELFSPESEEGRFLGARGQELRRGIEDGRKKKDANDAHYAKTMRDLGGLPESIGIDLRFLPLVHTQYVWGQLAAKLIRIGNDQENERRHNDGKKKDRDGDEKRWGPAAELVVTMAPDVGTSTNINPAMDEKIYGPEAEPNWEAELGVRDRRRPGLAPTEEPTTRHIRFEIAEANCMTAVGAIGKLRDRLGIPVLPMMTVYDFFIKRALDQLYYNLYWSAGFVVIGTPSGATLSPEGAQHSWKSDIQMPNLITWEPFFAIEVDWILSETVRRHFLRQDEGRSGVIIRAVTRATKQGELIKRLKEHRRFAGQSEAQILESTRRDALAGGYYLVDWRGFEGYEPGENVVQILTMGSVTTEALAACDRLREQGIFANVIVVTSADLLAGNLAHEDGYRHLRETLGVTADLHLTRSGAKGTELLDRADLVLAAGRRVPIVAVVDGEPGLLDNLGSIVGVRAETLALRKASKSGRPVDVFRYLHIDADSVFEAAGRVLTETALENVRISRSLVGESGSVALKADNGHRAEMAAQLWPPRQ